jgi:hypothetical protein
LVIDDQDAVKVGNWTEGQGLKGYVGYNYLYAGNNSKSEVRFEFKAPKAGSFEIRIAYGHHENRGDKVPVTVRSSAGSKEFRVNMRESAPGPDGFYSLGKFPLKQSESVTVVVGTENAGGNSHADAVQVVEVK